MNRSHFGNYASNNHKPGKYSLILPISDFLPIRASILLNVLNFYCINQTSPLVVFVESLASTPDDFMIDREKKLVSSIYWTAVCV
ncbi:hypothetical protein AAHA92_29630 [Salvia divinorum]|uniref:Maturase K n=1 Tax=Salvia divinorum TaxID=28513 RepID=A0ABD1FZ04_SALDI